MQITKPHKINATLNPERLIKRLFQLDEIKSKKL